MESLSEEFTADFMTMSKKSFIFFLCVRFDALYMYDYHVSEISEHVMNTYIKDHCKFELGSVFHLWWLTAILREVSIQLFFVKCSKMFVNIIL